MTSKPEISHVTRSKQQAMAAYDRLSRWYDWLAGKNELPLANLGSKKLYAIEGEKVLELGCGTGKSLFALANSVGDSGKVFGADLSRGMLTVASQRIARANLSRRVVLQQADGACLPFAGDSFDTVFMSFVLELFDTQEIPIVLSECRRVLKLDGQICVMALVRDEHENIPQQVYEWFHDLVPALVDCRPIYLQEALEQAGFQSRYVLRKMIWGLPVEICLAKYQTSAEPG